MSDDPLRPFTDLTPERVLDALDAAGQRGDGRMLQLNSYENRVFQVMLEDGAAVVAKFYRPGRWSDEQILEEHAFALELAADEVPVVAPLELHAADATLVLRGTPPTLACPRGSRYRFAVAPRCGGRAPELDDPEVLTRVGRFIGRLHAVGRRQRFAQRPALGPRTLGDAARADLLAGDIIPAHALAPWRAACDAALAAAHAAFERVEGLRTLRLHGDCHAGNLLWTDAGPHFVDLDDTATGPAIQDLWMLLSGDACAMAGQLAALLDGYRVFMDFDDRERSLVEPLRTLRMIHHSAWIARRWDDPAFPVAFPFFEGAAYWLQQAVQLREQVEAMARRPSPGRRFRPAAR